MTAVSNRQAFKFMQTIQPTPSRPDPKQTAIWKAMELSEKYNLLAATVRQAREFKRMGLRMKFPADSPAEIETKLASLWLHARP